MSVRNFYVKGRADGRATSIEGGPRSKTGELDLTVYIRDEGGIETGVRVACRERNGKLIMDVTPGTNVKVIPSDGGGFTVETVR